MTNTRPTRKTVSSIRLPAEPLFSLWDKGTSTQVIAEACGTTRRTVSKWEKSGIGVLTGDQVCIRLGLHPSDVWGDSWWDIARVMS